MFALRNPNLYSSCSAFSPIAVPSKAPWGIKAFSAYLGEDRTTWLQYDASHLITTYTGDLESIMIDIGTNDPFLKQQLCIDEFLKAWGGIASTTDGKKGKVDVIVNMREGYDHSYWYIQTFIDEHLAYHAKNLSRI